MSKKRVSHEISPSDVDRGSPNELGETRPLAYLASRDDTLSLGTQSKPTPTPYSKISREFNNSYNYKYANIESALKRRYPSHKKSPIASPGH